jgi:hypothetical protein
VILPLFTATTTAALRRITHRLVFGGGRPSRSSVSVKEAFMEQRRDDDWPIHGREVPLADCVEKFAAYPPVPLLPIIFTIFSRSAVFITELDGL